jgi:hypothetical protein
VTTSPGQSPHDPVTYTGLRTLGTRAVAIESGAELVGFVHLVHHYCPSGPGWGHADPLAAKDLALSLLVAALGKAVSCASCRGTSADGAEMTSRSCPGRDERSYRWLCAHEFAEAFGLSHFEGGWRLSRRLIRTWHEHHECAVAVCQEWGG